MRIGVLGSGVRWSGGLPPRHLVNAAEGAGLVGVGIRGALFPYTPADAVLVDAAHLDAGARLVAQQPNAILLDTFGEYALDALRGATGLPVVGAAEAAIAGARATGTRFAIVTVWPESMAWLYGSRLRRYGAEANCTGVTYVGTGTPIEQLRADVAAGAEALVAAVIRACRAAAAGGADSVVLGCTCMAPMHAELQAATNVPVLCASRLGLRAAIQHAGAGAPGATRHGVPPDPALVADLESGTGCPICVGSAPDA